MHNWEEGDLRMKKAKDLFIPSHDAIDYNSIGKRREQFLKMYNCTSHFERLMEKNCYFIIGDKGSGKTALALYHQLHSPDNCSSNLISINTTQYKQFIMLKINKKLEFTDYASIWRATLLMLMSQFISQKSKKWIHKITKKFSKIENAIKQYDSNSLLPQINTAIELATTLTAGGETNANAGNLGAKISASQEESIKETTEQIRFYINESEKNLKEALSDLKLSNDFIIFLDGLDARPFDILQEEFDYCIKGLYDALWQLNTEFFPRIKDSKGRMRFCLLIRPDIFESLNIYNSNSRVSDNSVYLNWITTESEYLNQNLYKTINKYFCYQNENDPTCGWNAYFPQRNSNTNNNFFVHLLKNTFIRPRDYFSAIEILINLCKDSNIENESFPNTIITSDTFNRRLSDYILGEIKNYLNFYISNSDYSEYIKFFDFLDGKSRFSWDEYMKYYNDFFNYMEKANVEKRCYYETPIKLLQFFYEANLIGYYQKPTDGSKTFIFWSYREKTINNLNPKVRENASYIVFEGVRKALNIGKSFKNPKYDNYFY